MFWENMFKVSCLSIIVVMWLGNYVITKHNYSIKISSSKFESLREKMTF